jgi:hypothetical protein
MVRNPPAQFTSQPSASESPVAIHGSRSHAQRVSNLLERQTAEEPHLEDLALAFIKLSEPVKGDVHGHHLVDSFGRKHEGFIDLEVRRVAAALRALMTASMIDQYVPHH